MSKSFGNVVDPLDWMDKYGSDAVRFTLARGANPGTDVPIGEDWVQASRNFANKIWNATRFALMNGATVEGPLPDASRAVGDRPLDPVPAQQDRRRSRRVLRRLPVREAVRRALPLRVGRGLRLVRRAVQDDVHGGRRAGEGLRPGPRRGPRRHAAAAAPGRPVRHGDALDHPHRWRVRRDRRLAEGQWLP